MLPQASWKSRYSLRYLLLFQRFHELLASRIVIFPLRLMLMGYLVLLEHLRVSVQSILHSAVGVMHQTHRRLPLELRVGIKHGLNPFSQNVSHFVPLNYPIRFIIPRSGIRTQSMRFTRS